MPITDYGFVDGFGFIDGFRAQLAAVLVLGLTAKQRAYWIRTLNKEK